MNLSCCDLQWRELELKVRQYDSLLHAPPALAAAPNMNALWARLTVEELCRSGITTFAIAPGAPPGARDPPCVSQAAPSMSEVWTLTPNIYAEQGGTMYREPWSLWMRTGGSPCFKAM